MTDRHVPAVGLLRGLGLAASTSVVVGSVIGTGIFLKTRVMMCNVETPWLVVAAWQARSPTPSLRP
jgi:APA family basic amino acid/polyamine antiporter